MYCSLLLRLAVLFALSRTVASASTIEIPSVSKEYVRNIQDQQEVKGSGPLQFAKPVKVSINPSTDGTWDARTQTWELTVESKGAKNLNLGFTRFDIPAGAELSIVNANPDKTDVPKVKADSTLNSANNQLWTPIMNTNRVKITLQYRDKEKRKNPPTDIHLGYVNVGFKSIGSGGNKSGSCNIDVVCPLRTGWEKEIRSVAAISLGGSLFCSGAMINNMESDGTPYFLTANHCGITSNNAASLVAYWNYETSVCGGSPDGTLDQFTVGGADFLSSTSQSDATLVRFVNDPDTSYGVTFAGWDNTPLAYQVNGPGVAIHHPSVDEKRISFEYDDMTTTSYLGNAVSPTGTHVRVSDWDEGTTEGGSSGSPLFNGDHRIIGQLHGGYAACGNDLADWYGRISRSWGDAGLGQWLDPMNVLNGDTGGVDTFDPLAVPTISPAPTPEPTSDFPSTAPSECTGAIFSLDLLTDNYPEETSWSLTDFETNEVVNEGGGYNSGSTLYQISSCLYGNCHTFEVFDSYGDGMCCSYGQGGYIVSVNGQEIGSGGDFDYAESLDFCVINDFPTAGPSSISSAAQCDDSPLPLYANGNSYSCAFLENYCSSEDHGSVVSSHCPFTCGACSEYACEDSVAQWLAGDDVHTCVEVANAIENDPTNIEICIENSSVAITCAGTCGICD